jgi:hypothetical protein
MEKNEVVSVVALSGEYVGKLKSAEGTTITLEDPRMLVHNEQGMGFAHGIAVTGNAEPKEVTFQNYVFAVKTNDEVEKAYRSATSGLIL